MLAYPFHNNHTPNGPKENNLENHILSHQHIQNRNRSLLPSFHKDSHLNSKTYVELLSSSTYYNMDFLLKTKIPNLVIIIVNAKSYYECKLTSFNPYKNITLLLAKPLMTCFVPLTISGINTIYNFNITYDMF